MPLCYLVEACAADTEKIVDLLLEMQTEVKELEFSLDVGRLAVGRSFAEGVKWFLFRSEQGHVFGCCYLQSVHKYWSLERRYYLGGFYIQPPCRGKGYFRQLNNQLETWAAAHEGTSIYAHIHEGNNKSLGAFAAVGLEACEYKLCHKGWE